MFILDTNVVSELRKVALGKANINVSLWASAIEPKVLYLSAVTIHELEVGILQLKRRNVFSSAILRKWMDTHVLQVFADRILPIDSTVAQRGASLHFPNTRPWADAFIAATALVHGMTIVTRNVSDFQSTGAAVLNPWLK